LHAWQEAVLFSFVSFSGPYLVAFSFDAQNPYSSFSFLKRSFIHPNNQQNITCSKTLPFFLLQQRITEKHARLFEQQKQKNLQKRA